MNLYIMNQKLLRKITRINGISVKDVKHDIQAYIDYEQRYKAY